MNELLLEPLKYYDSFAKNAISENAKQYFDDERRAQFVQLRFLYL